MPLFPGQGLAEAIVFELRQGTLETGELMVNLQRRGLKVTKQGVYKALRALRAGEIVFLQHGEVSLSVRWLQRLERFVTLTQHAYVDPAEGAGHFLNLGDGERITYSFKNPVLVDAFWNHVLYIILEAMPAIDRWFAYASHCWFMLGREKEERALYSFMNKRGVRVLYTVGHKMPLDRAITREFDGDWSQYHMLEKPLFSTRRNHLGLVINVLGDFVIEAQYDAKTVGQIEAFYRENNKIDTQKIRELEGIVTQAGRTSLGIMRNSTKAEKLSKLLGKGFYLPKTSS